MTAANPAVENTPKDTPKDTTGQPLRWPFAFILVALVAIFVSLPLFHWSLSPTDAWWRVFTWWIIMGVLVGFIVAAGWAIVGRPLGALVDERNRMSLSRLQLIVWTIVVLSAFMTIVFWNLYLGPTKDPADSKKAPGNTAPFAIQVPAELWLLMGISVTSLVGSPLIRSTKTRLQPKDNKQQVEKGKNLLTKSRPSLTNLKDRAQNEGVVWTLAEPSLASPVDMFEGEEVGNPLLDMGKIQMFFFTVVIVLGYATAIGTLLATAPLNAGISTFPALDASIIALLGISHAGYLGNKAVPHTETA